MYCSLVRCSQEPFPVWCNTSVWYFTSCIRCPAFDTQGVAYTALGPSTLCCSAFPDICCCQCATLQWPAQCCQEEQSDVCMNPRYAFGAVYILFLHVKNAAQSSSRRSTHCHAHHLIRHHTWIQCINSPAWHFLIIIYTDSP